jgi:endonuclease/exonuclease/phosphatase family metal-dependent hydrolase
VLGDFNRALSDTQDALLVELDDHEPATLTFVRASPARRGLCSRNRKLEAVDHVLLGGVAGAWMRPESFREITYAPVDDAQKVKLSDHCPLALELTLPKG